MRIKELRKERKYTQAQLAEILEISQQNMSKYETSKLEPDITSLMKLADFFDVSIDYLLNRSNIRNLTTVNIGNNQVACFSKDQQELLNSFNLLNKKNQGAILERTRMLLELQEEEISTNKKGASAS
ncbi:helix-turn-helix domain-containing protein [Aminipila butyrica]|uniref:Helix-turn-helix domain-containing protein n=1 Tax=Aminipila butyrica TaxID=433296 RepID=A0A858BXX0_9FIRM|nr:helix-turn-helix domain-containing protein [Aminipila butyrica]QIB69760.1 helix-turn-helix domain-containing protein [Aminipila butyrica]